MKIITLPANMKTILNLLVLASFVITLHAEQLSPSDLVEMTALKKAVDDAHTACKSTYPPPERSNLDEACEQLEQEAEKQFQPILKPTWQHGQKQVQTTR